MQASTHINQHQKNRSLFSLQWLALLGLALIMVIAQPERFSPLSLNSLSEVLIALAVGAAFNLIFGVFLMVPQLRPYAGFAALPAFWAITGFFVYLSNGIPLLVTVVAITMLLMGMFGLDWVMGTINAIGVLSSAVIGLGLTPSVGFTTLTTQTGLYTPQILVYILLSILAGVWSYLLDEDSTVRGRHMRDQLIQQTNEMESMRNRARAVADMSTNLNASLNFERVLDAALDIGRFSLRDDPRQRVVSIVLLVHSEQELKIETARGLNHIDMQQRFRGDSGILAKTLREGVPIIGERGEADPELGRLNAFRNIESILTIPLRAGYQTYGVLVYGSTQRKAFQEDHIDTLQAIGIQATLALQNAVLYSDLIEEKERIISIEENARKALVRDLHDVPTQTVSAVAMRLAVIPMMLERSPSQIPAEIEEIREMALRATAEIRHVMFTLRPLSLETQGLAAALEQLAEKTLQTYKQKVRIFVHDQARFMLSEKSEGTLFYLIEEAVNNARKYAKASLIRVDVTTEGSEVVARVSDNGVGFDASSVDHNYEKRGSFGMVNMRERAELIGGRFELHSQVGVGTTITVRIPASKTGVRSPEPTSQPNGKAPTKQQLRRNRVGSGPLSPST